jgi:uncharacterized protein YkwD
MSSVMTSTTWSPMATRRTRTTMVMLLMAVVGVALAACTPPVTVESTNLQDLNKVRAAVGLPELVRTPELDAKAKAQADRMAARGTIFHSSNLASGVTEGWSSIGENVALAGSVPDAQRALEASPGHYANMVHPEFNQVGIGVTVRNGITYVVQVFVSR